MGYRPALQFRDHIDICLRNAMSSISVLYFGVLFKTLNRKNYFFCKEGLLRANTLEACVRVVRREGPQKGSVLWILSVQFYPLPFRGEEGREFQLCKLCRGNVYVLSLFQSNFEMKSR